MGAARHADPASPPAPAHAAPRAWLRAGFDRVEGMFDRAYGARANPWRQLGALAWLLFIVAAVTGVYVYAAYDTSAAGAHAMTTLTDPAHPDRAPRVQSNGEFYASAEEGYRSGTQVVAGRNVGQIDTRFVRGATLDEAEARNRLANPNAR